MQNFTLRYDANFEISLKYQNSMITSCITKLKCHTFFSKFENYELKNAKGSSIRIKLHNTF